jgi:hypothetical protein
VHGDDIINSRRAKNVQIIAAVSQVQCGKQSHQTVVVVTMQVADKNMPEPAQFQPITAYLHLGAFPAINEKALIIYP